MKTYGKAVLIRHPDGYVSVYADNSELDVKEGDAVKRGQIIAKSGASGEAGSPMLHFELRKDGKPVNPTKYLVPL
jgi:murein DD-endopeptidase MepM/ murein hydrolase activator NlpD